MTDFAKTDASETNGRIEGMPKAEFTGKCGENSSATSDKGLQPEEEVSLNGTTDLNTCIRGNDDACVYWINLTGSPGIYDYVIHVDAQGPKGGTSGSFYLAFTDESKDTYYLSITSSHRSTHTVRFNSDQPAIQMIQWSNSPIG